MNSDRNAPKLIDQASTSATTYYTPWVDKRKFSTYSFLATWGTVTGTITIEATNDGETLELEARAGTAAASSAARKTDVTITATNPSGSAGGWLADVETAAGWVRMKVVVSVGTGALYVDGQGVE